MCSRGCRKMHFSAMWGANIGWRSIEHIMQEIKNDVRDYKIGETQFDDDSLTLNKKMLYSLCNELEKIDVPGALLMKKVNYHLREQYDMYKAMRLRMLSAYSCLQRVKRVLDDIVKKIFL